MKAKKFHQKLKSNFTQKRTFTREILLRDSDDLGFYSEARYVSEPMRKNRGTIRAFM